jgi:hypothetical protein
MRPTSSNLQIRTPPTPGHHGVDSDSESELEVLNHQAAPTNAYRRKRVKMHDVHVANVARLIDIEAEVSEDETGSSDGSDSDNNSGTPLLRIPS